MSRCSGNLLESGRALLFGGPEFGKESILGVLELPELNLHSAAVGAACCARAFAS